MAKIVSNSNELSTLFINCCNKYDRISFITAWAGKENTIIETLYKNRHKIKQSSVGLHFYQTSPDFIKKFWDINEVQYHTNRNTDIFHPKAYLFYNQNETDWVTIIGSSNLTNGGFSNNIECNVVLTALSDDKKIFNSIKMFINDCWKDSRKLTKKEFEEYSTAASNSISSLKQLRKPVCPQINGLDWGSYIKRMAENQTMKSINSHEIKVRLDLLDKTQELFSKYKKLKDFPEEYAEAVCGLKIKYKEIEEWVYFGSMTANGIFRSRFRQKYLKGLSNSLDIIPLKGNVTKSDFEKFVSSVKSITNFNNPITICTRLLAMKRPDMFVCAAGRTSKNGEMSTISKLCDLLNLNRKTIELKNYWDLIINSIQNSNWYLTDPNDIPNNQIRIYKYRAAMLDALYY